MHFSLLFVLLLSKDYSLRVHASGANIIGIGIIIPSYMHCLSRNLDCKVTRF